MKLRHNGQRKKTTVSHDELLDEATHVAACKLSGHSGMMLMCADDLYLEVSETADGGCSVSTC